MTAFYVCYIGLSSEESHSDGRILSDSDRNLIGFRKEFDKTMKSYGIPGDGSTVGSWCWNPIGSNVGIHRNPTSRITLVLC